MKNPLLRTAITLLLICGLAAGLVATVYHVTLPVTTAREKAQKEAAVLSVFPDASLFKAEAATPKGSVEELTRYLDPQSGEIRGFVGIATGSGFGGAVRFVIAADESGRLLGLTPLSHSETPGVGSRVMEGEFLSTLNGKSYPVSESVDTVSGATVSSEALLALADEFLLLVREEAKK